MHAQAHMPHAHQDQLSGLTDDDPGRISSAEKGKQHRIRSMAAHSAEPGRGGFAVLRAANRRVL